MDKNVKAFIVSIVFAIQGCSSPVQVTRHSTNDLRAAGLDLVADRAVIHPRGTFGGEALEWKVLTHRELDSILELKMPLPDEIAGGTVWDAIEKTSNRKIMWVPDLQEDESQVSRDSYATWLNRRNLSSTPPRLGALLGATLSAMTEVGFHLPRDQMLETEFMNIAIFTKTHIIIIAVPIE